jgi:regulatory protein
VRQASASPPDPADADADDPPADPEAVARQICLQQLDRRARSRAELAAVLNRRGVPDDAATRVLDRFAEVGLIDDVALAELIADAQQRERGLARRAVAVKLRQRGFDETVVGATLTGIDVADERVRAVELVTKRSRALAGLPAEVQARRLVALLARKGYPSGLAYQVVRQVLAEASADDGLVDALARADDSIGEDISREPGR